MKIGLVQYQFKNNDVPFNLSQIHKAIKNYSKEVDLLCFGESFLQGFDSLSWEYEKDKEIAITIDSKEFDQIKDWSMTYDVAILFGYFERNEDSIFSSCALIHRGEVIHNYRRISVGWKEVSKATNHYQEGKEIKEFTFLGKDFLIGLCGDLWDVDWEKFKTDVTIIWPIYVNFSLEDWKNVEKEYAKQAGKISPRILMINSLSEDPIAYGGTFDIKEGEIINRLSYNEENVLIVEV